MREAVLNLRLLLLLVAAISAHAQTPAPAESASPRGPITKLYEQLGSVGLDPQRVWRVREAHIDRPGLHLTLTEGLIALVQEVNASGIARTTGAFFSGEGYVLVMPPNRAERASLGLFTGSPTLNTKFTSAYLRFNDSTVDELKPSFRPFELDPETPEETPQAFLDRWGAIVLSLSEADRLRLLQTVAGGAGPRDGFFHARLGGTANGAFDVYYDSLAAEPVQVAQVAPTPNGLFLDFWTSFAPQGTGRLIAGGGSAPDAEAGVTERRDFFQISDYKIRARIHPPRELEATTELTLEATGQAPRVILLELSRFLHVSAVAQIDDAAPPSSGTPLEFIREEAQRGSKSERTSNDVIAVALPAPLAVGQRVRLRFAYSGEVLFDAGGGLLLVGVRGTWFPNRGFNQAKFDMEFSYPTEWTLAATGDLRSTTTENGLRVTRWVTPEPRPTAGFNLGTYYSAETKAGDVTVSAYINRNFVPPRPITQRAPDVNMRRAPGSQPPVISTPPLPAGARAEQVAHDAAGAVEWLSARLGPFPYRELRLSETPITSSQGWPGLIFLSSLAFFTAEERERRIGDPFTSVMYGHITIAHEIGHQWFGNQVGRATYRDAWFDEAVVNYLSLMRTEQESAGDFRTAMEHYRAELLKKNEAGQPTLEAGPVTLGDRLDSSHFPDGYAAIIYGRGTWLIHMLRCMMRDAAAQAPTTRTQKHAIAPSDEAFFSVLRSLVAQFKEKRMSNADVQRAFEAAWPQPLRYEDRKSLEWFFDGWVNGTAIPRYSLDDVKISARGGKTIATAKLMQSDAPDDLVTAVPIYAQRGGGKPVFVGHVFADGEETSLRLSVPAGTQKLLVDPYWTVLRQ